MAGFRPARQRGQEEDAGRKDLRKKLAGELQALVQEANADYLERHAAGHPAGSATRVQLLDALAADFEATLSAKEVPYDNLQLQHAPQTTARLHLN